MQASFSKITRFFRPYAEAGRARSSSSQSASADAHTRQSSSSLSAPPDDIISPPRRTSIGNEVKVVPNRQSIDSLLARNASHDFSSSSEEHSDVDETALTSVETKQSDALPSTADAASPTVKSQEFKPLSSSANDGRKPTIQLTGSSFSSTASRRVTIDNVKAVTNSDSEGFSASSDDGLLDLDDLIARKRRKITPPVGSISKPFIVPDIPERSAPVSRKRPAKKSYRHSLSSIVAQHTADSASEDRIVKTEAVLSAQEAVHGGDTALSVPAAAYADDHDKQKIGAALARIEAGDDGEPFAFFRRAVQPQPNVVFPLTSLHTNLHKLCQSPRRQNFFTSGFAADMAKVQGLPDELIEWINNELIHESSAQLREAYLHVLSSVQKGDLPSAVTEVCLLSRRYPDSTCVDESTIHKHIPVPDSLRSVVHVIQLSAPQLSSQQRIAALFELVLLNADSQLPQLPQLGQEIEHTLDVLLSTYDGDQVKDLFPPLINELLTSQLLSKDQLYSAIASLPPTTIVLFALRRQLAIQSILAAEGSDELVDLSSADTATRLLVKMKRDPRFDVRSNQSWASFGALMQVLDIAIDNGFSSYSPMMSEKNGGHLQRQLLDDDEKTSPAELDLNRQIDELVKRLQLMLNNIRDGGTSGLSRTYAKSALEALCVRLKTCARTKVKSSTGLFGDATSIKQRSFLERYLRQDNEAAVEV